MEKGNDSVWPQNELDLRGLRQRLPRRLIGWYAERLAADEMLSLAIGMTVDSERLNSLVQALNLEIVADRSDAGDRIVTMRKRPGRSNIIELDVRGERCPAPVIEARRRLRTMKAGDRLKLVSDCTGSPVELDTWTANSRHAVMLGRADQGGEHIFLIGRV